MKITLEIRSLLEAKSDLEKIKAMAKKQGWKYKEKIYQDFGDAKMVQIDFQGWPFDQKDVKDFRSLVFFEKPGSKEKSEFPDVDPGKFANAVYSDLGMGEVKSVMKAMGRIAKGKNPEYPKIDIEK